MLSRDEIFPILVLDTPSAPTNIILTNSTWTSITVAWSEPKDTGNRPIISYFVEMKKPASVRTRKNYTVTDSFKTYQHTFNDLQANTTYTLYVTAYNTLGRGPEAMQAYETFPYIRPGR